MEWRPLDKNSEYEVSNTGIIRKVQYKKAIKDKDGYLLTMITQNGKSRVRLVQRILVIIMLDLHLRRLLLLVK